MNIIKFLFVLVAGLIFIISLMGIFVTVSHWYIPSFEQDKMAMAKIVDLESRLIKIQAEFITFRDQIRPKEVTVTAYSPRKSETDDSPFTTAYGTNVKGWTVAVSRDLFEAGWTKGKSVYLYQIGTFTIVKEQINSPNVHGINDMMHPDKKRHIDVFFFDTKTAKKFGKPHKVKAVLLDLKEG